ncbi:hypothetical protein CcCBS67573_g00615 [Chytriomyces confervae]|uniref:Uncharacterized protein n=1 Tax=Chytriomyces confervae TaxID=246404 RepID=A0A507FSE0_9FUNG|nr:hypothetical protein CcCBS67573_g00615 [Chytriomyces confervae]
MILAATLILFWVQLSCAIPLFRRHEQQPQNPPPYKSLSLARVQFKNKPLDRRAKYVPKYNIQYWGGPVLHNAEISNIFLGSKVLNQTAINNFSSFYVRSQSMDLMALEYSPPGKPAVGYGKFVDSILETTPKYEEKGVWTDEDIQAYLLELLDAGKLKPNENSLYGLFLAPGVNLTQGYDNAILQACNEFCAYHSGIDISARKIPNTPNLYYAVYPDQTGACLGGCGVSSDPFKNMCSVIAHEIAEAITNPAITLALSPIPGPPLSWLDPDTFVGGEIGDMCNTLQDVLIDSSNNASAAWTVQKLWSNKFKACIAKIPTSGTTTTRRTATTTTTTMKRSTSTTASSRANVTGATSIDPVIWLPSQVMLTATSLTQKTTIKVAPTTLANTKKTTASPIKSTIKPAPKPNPPSASKTKTQTKTTTKQAAAGKPVPSPSKSTAKAVQVKTTVKAPKTTAKALPAKTTKTSKKGQAAAKTTTKSSKATVKAPIKPVSQKQTLTLKKNSSVLKKVENRDTHDEPPEVADENLMESGSSTLSSLSDETSGNVGKRK